MIKKIVNTFIPIVTIYTVASKKFPLESIMSDDALLSRAFLSYQERVGYDSIPLMADSTFTAEAFGCEIDFNINEAFVSRPLEFSSIGEIKRIKPPKPEECKRLALILKAINRVSQSASAKMPVISNSTAPLTSAAKMIGLENLAKKMVTDPDFVLSVLDKVTDFIISFAHALVRAGAQIIFIADPVASPALISPKMFKRFVVPSLKRLIETISCPVILHICGDIYPILQDMIETGPDILSLDQCVNLKEARHQMGKEMFLGGNIDPGAVLFEKIPEQVAEASWQCCMEGGPENFILMPGCTIVPGTPIDNIRAMMNVANDALV